jgi:small subunit ribosomal protein S20
MANTKSAAKRAKQTVARTVQNRAVQSTIKTHTKSFEAAVKAGNKEESKATLKTLSSALDKAAKEGRVHQNLADRRKSRLAKKLAALA